MLVGTFLSSGPPDHHEDPSPVQKQIRPSDYKCLRRQEEQASKSLHYREQTSQDIGEEKKDEADRNYNLSRGSKSRFPVVPWN